MDLKIGEVNEIGNENTGKFPEDYYRQLSYLLWVPSSVKHTLVVTSRLLWWPFVHKASGQQFTVVCIDQGWCKKIADATVGWKKIHYLKNTQEIISTNLGKFDLAIICGVQIGDFPDVSNVGTNAYRTLIEKVYGDLNPGGCLFVGVESWLDILGSVTEPMSIFNRFRERWKCCHGLNMALSNVPATEQISLFAVPFLWRPWLLVGSRAKVKVTQDAISQVGGRLLTRLLRFFPSWAILFLFRWFFPARLWIVRKPNDCMD